MAAGRNSRQKIYRSNNRISHKKRSNSVGALIFGLVIFSGFLAWQENRQNRQITLQNPIDVLKNVSETNRSKQIDPSEIGRVSYLNRNEYDRIDTAAASLNYSGTSVSELASLLSSYTNTELEKARIIYSWLAYHIDYDVPAFLGGEYGDVSPAGVLSSRKGVCSGYANLYVALAEKMGLEAAIVQGYAKGLGYITGSDRQINHAWNAVKIDGRWYLLDATWGAGGVSNDRFVRRFNPHYFATEPEQLIYDHFPSNTNWQLLATPYSQQEFDLLPKVSPQFFQMGLQLVSHKVEKIEAGDRVEIVLQAPEEVIASARLKQGDTLLPPTYHFVQRQGQYLKISASFPHPGLYELEIFSKLRQDSGDYPHAITYQIAAGATGAEFPLSYASFVENQAVLHAPMSKRLPQNSRVNFTLEVPSALDVQIIDTTSRQWTKLDPQGNLFSGVASVSTGSVRVAAKFAGDSRYWTLLEYN